MQSNKPSTNITDLPFELLEKLIYNINNCEDIINFGSFTTINIIIKKNIKKIINNLKIKNPSEIHIWNKYNDTPDINHNFSMFLVLCKESKVFRLHQKFIGLNIPDYIVNILESKTLEQINLFDLLIKKYEMNPNLAIRYINELSNDKIMQGLEIFDKYKLNKEDLLELLKSNLNREQIKLALFLYTKYNFTMELSIKYAQDLTVIQINRALKLILENNIAKSNAYDIFKLGSPDKIEQILELITKYNINVQIAILLGNNFDLYEISRMEEIIKIINSSPYLSYELINKFILEFDSTNISEILLKISKIIKFYKKYEISSLYLYDLVSNDISDNLIEEIILLIIKHRIEYELAKEIIIGRLEKRKLKMFLDLKKKHSLTSELAYKIVTTLSDKDSNLILSSNDVNIDLLNKFNLI